MTDPAAQPERLKPGQMLGPWTLLKHLGATRWTDVFQARDGLTGKLVQLTQLHPTTNAEPQQLHAHIARYLAGYKTIAATNPRLAQQIDTVLAPQTGVCVVSEWLEGPTLADLLAGAKVEIADGPIKTDRPTGDTNPSQALDVKQTLGIIATAAQGLASMHAQNMAHGCLTPARLKLTGRSQLKVTDPGFWILIDPQFLLSPDAVPYAAPELMAGQAPSPASDFYALGMMAYQALAGPAAYAEAFKTVLRDQRNQALRWMKWQGNAKLQAPLLHTINPDVPEAVSQLVARMVDKSPGARLSQANVLIQAIQQHILPTSTGTPGSGVNVGTGPMAAAPLPGVANPGTPTPQAPLATGGHTRAIKSSRRMPMLWGSSIALWIVLVLVLVAFWTDHRRTQRRAFVAPIYDQIQIAANNIQDDNPTVAVTHARTAVELANDDPKLKPLAEAWLLLTQGVQAEATGDNAKARKLYQDALALHAFRSSENTQAVQRRLANAISQAAFDDGLNRIDQAINQGKHADAQALINAWQPLIHPDEAARLDAMETKLFAAMGTDSVETVLQRVDTRLANGRAQDALTLLQQQIDRGVTDPAIVNRHRQLQKTLDVQAHVATARQAVDNAQWTQAVAAYDLALALSPADSALQTARDNAQAMALVHQARQAIQSGDSQQAQALLEEALQTVPNHEQAQAMLNGLDQHQQRTEAMAKADLAATQRQWDQAIGLYQQALRASGDQQSSQVVQTKLTDAKTNQALDQAEQAMVEHDIAKAQTLVQTAQQLNAQGGRLSARVAEVQKMLATQQAFDRWYLSAKQAMAEGKYGTATTQFLKARKIQPSQELDALIEQAQFAHLVQQTKQYIQAGNVAEAKAMWTTLAAQRPQDPILAELEQAIANIR